MNRIKLLLLILLFVIISGCAHHIVNGVEVKLPPPEEDITRKPRF